MREARKLFVALAAGLLLTPGGVACYGIRAAQRLVGVFGCDGGPTAGHPGSPGRKRAMATGNTTEAWSAYFNSDQIDNCP